MATVIADTTSARTRRVWSVVHAGRRLADPRDPLGLEARRRLPESSKLTRPGVELALGRYLETSPTCEQVAQLVASAGSAARVWVLLAANVCTAPLRALAWAAATAPRVWVRPSTRDAVVAELLAQALAASHDFAHAGGLLSLTEQLAPLAGDELHLYGSDETLREVAGQTDAGVTVQPHGTGLGIAVVGRDESPQEAAPRLAEDIGVFDQRGCLSPRFVLVEGGPDRAAELARELDRALLELGIRLPRGPLDRDEREAAARFRATAAALGSCLAGPDHCVGLDRSPRTLLLPPPLRCIWVVACDASTVERLLQPWLHYAVTVGGVEGAEAGSLGARVAELLPHARRAALGAMQTPPLDGPVDLRRDG